MLSVDESEAEYERLSSCSDENAALGDSLSNGALTDDADKTDACENERGSDVEEGNKTLNVEEQIAGRKIERAFAFFFCVFRAS